ncbi:carbohydrate ABC transporter permease [Paenibacillus alginolyticus]|uniref:Carbohydrate ABC transporter permease n=1 Tax=Paenibacillus alginolyticus TaxID=59839 RepID=A0ABT4GMP6_9BACL|nr:carbohydrate ABC transporter permease [Paenibacillus alginolyticus]MCY9668116.1 carbohydrate ABC transporter permease [Paenibacillus alginolyticus]MCY9697474.1 carbohydrate ABC transporter permease [Paenibacillus alginolyticus]MEC0148291.1 carbohydrate ABC transporter permease [Paenibacillus alginolyticus]
MRHNTLGGKMFDIFNYVFLAIVAMVMIIPIMYIVAGSFASDSEISARAFFIIPEHITFNAYEYVFKDNALPRSLGVSAFVTVAGTIVNLLFTLTLAYALSRRQMLGRTLFLNMIIFTLVFSGGMIPTYLVVKSLGLLNSYLALMLPVAINTYNLIVVKSFFQELPAEVLEASRIDGCTDLSALWHIVLPLSKPVIATFALFYAVEHWNDFFNALLYMNDSHKWPMQVLLRQIVLLATGSLDMSTYDPTYVKPPDQSIKMAVVVVGTIPILILYPFLQKYFAKGVMIGAVKG